MAWSFLKGRTGRDGQDKSESPKQPPSVGAVDFEDRWNALLRNDPEIARIADELKALGPRWVRVFARSYLSLNDRQCLPIILRTIYVAAGEDSDPSQLVDRGSATFASSGPQTLNPHPLTPAVDEGHKPLPVAGTLEVDRIQAGTKVLLEADDLLDATEAHSGKLIEAIRYFVELGRGGRPREFAEINQSIADANTLVSYSSAISARMQDLRSRVRSMAAGTDPQRGREEAEHRTQSHPSLPPVAKPLREQDKVDMVLSEIDDLLTGTMTKTKPPSQTGDDKYDKKSEHDTQAKAPISQPVLVVAKPENDDQSKLPKQLRRQEQEPSEAVLAEIRALLAR